MSEVSAQESGGEGIGSHDEFRKLKVVELKAELAKLGLSTAGKKDELVRRLAEAAASVAHPTSNPAGESNDLTNVKTGISRTKDNVAKEGSDKMAQAKEAASTELDDKLAARAARFNLPATSAPPSASEPARKLQRLQRFGLQDNPATDQSPPAKTSALAPPIIDDLEKLKARQARFGGVTSSALAAAELEEQRLKRAQRFGPANQ